jgi:FHS family L-fucose permease-like MFS transporter
MTTQKPTNNRALSVLVIVFFFWGFIAAGNSVFIPFCKHYFDLDQFQSQLIDFAFYSAYFLGALCLFAFSSFGGKDLVGRWGYKRSIVFGLLFSSVGAAVMIWAVNANTFAGMLTGLFIVALGFSLQQTAANPFAISLGDPATGTSRINLGGGVNSFGTTIGPLVVTLALFGSFAFITDDQIKDLKLSKVMVLYSCVGALFIIAGSIFAFSKNVPSGILTEKTEKAGKALIFLTVLTIALVALFTPVFRSYQSPESLKVAELGKTAEDIQKQLDAFPRDLQQLGAKEPLKLEQHDALNAQLQKTTSERTTLRAPLEEMRMKWLSGALLVVVLGLLVAFLLAKNKPAGWGAMQYPHLVLGMLAIFVYVGVEVAIGSNLSELLKQPDFGGLAASQAVPYISMYWGSLMIGRWTGALSAFTFSKTTRTILQFVVPLVAFLVIMGVNTLGGYDMGGFWFYLICVLVQVLAARVAKDSPGRTLLVFGGLGMAAMLVGIATTGTIAVYAFLAGGLFCSVMWPCIFNLALSGLGKYTTQGSAFLIMMILGGGIIPPLQGKLSDLAGIHASYWVAVVCFAYLAWYALYSGRIFNRNNALPGK